MQPLREYVSAHWTIRHRAAFGARSGSSEASSIAGKNVLRYPRYDQIETLVLDLIGAGAARKARHKGDEVLPQCIWEPVVQVQEKFSDHP